MKLENLSIKAMLASFEPEFHLTMQYEIVGHVLPIKYLGFLLLDGYKFASLHEYSSKRNYDVFFSSLTSGKGIHTIVIEFISPFSLLALSKLEEKRATNQKGDLEFTLQLKIEYLEPAFSHIWNPKSSQQVHDNIVTIPSTDNSLLRKKEWHENKTIKISSGDWLHDFYPVFNKTKFQVFEIPIPQVNKGTKKINVIINEAIKSLVEIDKAKRQNDWNKVIQESRPVWELLNRKKEIEGLLKDDGFDEAVINSYKDLIESFFDFSSKFIHRESKDKKIMKKNNPNKEDAELVYLMAYAIVNLISKKL